MSPRLPRPLSHLMARMICSSSAASLVTLKALPRSLMLTWSESVRFWKCLRTTAVRLRMSDAYVDCSR